MPMCSVPRRAQIAQRHPRVANLLPARHLAGLSFSMGGAVGLALSGQCLFMAFFSLGAGPCSMMVAAECFPLQVPRTTLALRARCDNANASSLDASSLALLRAMPTPHRLRVFAQCQRLAA